MVGSTNPTGDAVRVKSHCVCLLPDQKFLEVAHATEWPGIPSRD
jgi:hypothetical protein